MRNISDVLEMSIKELIVLKKEYEIGTFEYVLITTLIDSKLNRIINENKAIKKNKEKI